MTVADRQSEGGICEQGEDAGHCSSRYWCRYRRAQCLGGPRGQAVRFKEADRYNEGCRTIPATYSSDRDACDREGPNVHPWCDGSKGPVTCISEEETRKAKRGVEDAKKSIQDLKDKKSKAESNRSSASTDDEKKKFSDEISQIEKDLYDAGKKLDQAEKDLDTRKKLVEDAIYTLDKCISYRRAVMNSFASALDKVRNESEPLAGLDLAGMHPRMASERQGPTVVRQLEPPGFLALHYGSQTPISIVLGHLVFGIVLGVFYARA